MSDTPMTDAVIENVPMRGTYAEYREAQFIKVSEHARRLEKALKVAEAGLHMIRNSYLADIDAESNFRAATRFAGDTLSTIAKLKEAQ